MIALHIITLNSQSSIFNLFAELATLTLCQFAAEALLHEMMEAVAQRLKGEGAECWCNGCVIADKSQHVDNNTLIDHQVSHCTSHELYKYVLDDKATGAFAGRVLVRHDAQKTVSEEVNQNLCATKTARMYTQPMLEIYADDVKCSHGSTVGQLNDAALF